MTARPTGKGENSEQEQPTRPNLTPVVQRQLASCDLVLAMGTFASLKLRASPSLRARLLAAALHSPALGRRSERHRSGFDDFASMLVTLTSTSPRVAQQFAATQSNDNVGFNDSYTSTLGCQGPGGYITNNSDVSSCLSERFS